MARTSMIEKSKRPLKYKVRQHNRCRTCGRPKAYYRYFGLCRVCLRENAHRGLLPGVKKSSW